MLHACCRRGDRGPGRQAAEPGFMSTCACSWCFPLASLLGSHSARSLIRLLSQGLPLPALHLLSLPYCKSALLASAPGLYAILARTLSSFCLQMEHLEHKHRTLRMVNRLPLVFAPSALARNGHHLILTWHMSYGKNISP